MNPDLLLIVGTCFVVLIMGLEFGASMAGGLRMVEPEIPDSLNDLAVKLGKLHKSHADSTAKKKEFEEFAKTHGGLLEDLLDRIRKEYSI